MRFLKDGILNSEFIEDERLCTRSTGFDLGNSAAIEETIAADEDSKDEVEDFWKGKRQLKREKQCQK